MGGAAPPRALATRPPWLLSLRDPDGKWGGGIYSPKWISTNYTLLLLRNMGLPRDNPAGSAGARLLLGNLTGEAFKKRLLSK